MRNALTIGITTASLFWFSAAVGSQSLLITDFDFRAAEQRLKDLYPFTKSLHEAERGPDGTRGFGLPMPTSQRVAPPNPPPPPFNTTLEWETYYQYCARDAIVRATHVDSKPVLTSDKSFIYTISHFAIVDTIKSDVSFTSGQHLVVYRVGGEVEDGGEKLRIDTPDSAAFESQKSYILILQHDKTASVTQYFIPQSQTITVTNDKVYPISGKYAWLSGMDAFQSGSTYTVMRDTFAKVHALKSCPDAR
jgi:hypothetical protein